MKNRPRISTPPSITGPLLVWLICQLFALALASARVPLSAHFPQPAEQMAIQEMIAIQLIVSGMLFPYLMRNVESWATICLSAAPLLLLAGLLSSTPISTVAWLWVCIACWLTGLALWRAVLPSKFHLAAVAIANVLILGGTLLWYLRADFGDETSAGWIRLLPLPSLIISSTDQARWRLPLPSTILLLAFGGMALLISQRLSRSKTVR